MTEKLIQEQVEALKLQMKLARDMAPEFAKTFKVMFDAFVKEGFNEEQAVALLASGIISGGSG